MKKFIIILISMLSINAFGQMLNVIKEEPRRILSIYYIEKTDKVIWDQFQMREVVIPKNTLPRRGPMVFKSDTVIVQQLEWGFRTETYFQMSEDSHTELHYPDDTIKKQPHSILWGYN